MEEFKVRKSARLPLSLATAIISLYLLSAPFEVRAVPNGPGLVGIIPPPQVLLPPHREEGQSLDDIIYGTSFSGGSLFPSSLNSLPSTTTTERPSSNLFTTRAPFPPASQPIGRRANANLVQTFVPPAPQLPSTTTTTTTTTPRPLTFPLNSIFASSSRPAGFSSSSSSSSVSSSTSAEEIKVPQALKHRTPHRKQYSKADLVAAANSLRPAGFDFNKVVTSKPTTFNNSVTIYQHAKFPLPLFDTPVFNELRPLMEMIFRQRQLQAEARGRSNESDNLTKLVIIPKSSPRSVNIESGPTTTATSQENNRKAKHLPFASATTATSQIKLPSPNLAIISPKNIKLATTAKPKPATITTKRVSKFSEIPKKSDKNPDLQVAATSNKLTQQKSSGGSGKAASSSTGSEKRSYSIKGADKYSFSYEVKNDAFGDVKSHSESRDGDQVAGEYSMLEPDGYTRVVRYTVDSDQGFKASVKRIPPS